MYIIKQAIETFRTKTNDVRASKAWTYAVMYNSDHSKCFIAVSIKTLRKWTQEHFMRGSNVTGRLRSFPLTIWAVNLTSDNEKD